MGADQHLDWRHAAASALDWWRDAGVDVLTGDAPFAWLQQPLEPVAAASVPTSDRPRPVPALDLPPEFDAFLAWRTGDAAPEAGGSRAPIAPSGPPGADVMVLVDCPERDDRERLMEGEIGRLFDAMLAAIGRSRADIHLASVCTVRPTGGRLPRDLHDRLGEIARHHVGLARPKRVLALGDAASRALTTTNVAEARGRLLSLNHKTGTLTEVVASFHPRLLMERPALKAEAWRDLQLLIGGLS